MASEKDQRGFGGFWTHASEKLGRYRGLVCRADKVPVMLIISTVPLRGMLASGIESGRWEFEYLKTGTGHVLTIIEWHL